MFYFIHNSCAKFFFWALAVATRSGARRQDFQGSHNPGHIILALILPESKNSINLTCASLLFAPIHLQQSYWGSSHCPSG